VFGIAAASRNTRFPARYGLTRVGLAPADRAMAGAFLLDDLIGAGEQHRWRQVADQ